MPRPKKNQNAENINETKQVVEPTDIPKPAAEPVEKPKKLLIMELEVPLYITGFKNRADFEDNRLETFIFHNRMKNRLERALIDRCYIPNQNGKLVTKFTLFEKG
ncbi:MAG: hypothetical protein WC372_10995 [Candidatus Neomarinimicrobiota bacterium]|jgi:hypothetical protein|nr:hypothetical protein [Candidatus Neomarinimicrobiota bacterium]